MPENTPVLKAVWNGRVYDDADQAADLSAIPAVGELARLGEYEPGVRLLAVMGWDGYVLLDKRADVVDMARAYMAFVQTESCGKCVPCRMGTRVAADILARIADGRGREEDLQTLRRVGRLVQAGSMCELGHTSMNGVLALLDTHEALFRRSIAEGVRHPRGRYRIRVTAPCIEACPERLDIPRYIENIKRGRYADSLVVIREKNPLASVCGRVCVRFCELACRRGQLDSPVDIKHLKQFVSDVEMDAAVKRVVPTVNVTPDAKRVAIVGAGPAGMTAAYHLLTKGYRVTLFEATDEPGGMAATGIPDYRLPREVLRAELRIIEDMGAEIRYGRRLGTDLTLKDLRDQGYQAVFLAIGAQLGHRLGVPGESPEPAGYHIGVEFLREVNRDQPISMGRKVVVVGGGNVAMDCSRSALRMGAQVHLVYRRTREAMPADQAEVRDAEEEGVIYHFLCNPTRVLVEGGAVVGVECVRMSLGEPDASGRRRPIPIDGSEFVIDCDMLLPAIGQQVDASWFQSGEDPELTPWGTVAADPDTLATSMPGVFAGGDCVSGPASLIEAMAAGMRVSNSIDQYLREGRVTLTDDERMSRVLRALTQGGSDVVDRLGGGESRVRMSTRPVAERLQDFGEVGLGLSPEDALLEADRCLRCYRILLVATES